MQINYCNEKDRRATAPGYAWLPNVENSLRAMDVPPIYAPYGTPEFWTNQIAAKYQGSQNAVLNTPDTSISPNSGGGNNVTSAAIAASYGVGDAPAPSAAVASATGAPLAPASLVATMPSITQSPAAPPPPVAPCNPVDSWVSQNSMLAGLGIIAAFLLFGGHR